MKILHPGSNPVLRVTKVDHGSCCLIIISDTLPGTLSKLINLGSNIYSLLCTHKEFIYWFVL